MPIEPNVLNYFLVVLGGFGAVWGFRFFTHRQGKSITEFEYAAFSTIWGIPVFLVFIWELKDRTDLIDAAFKVPLTATPTLFCIGVLGGFLAAMALSGLKWVLRKLGGQF